MPTGRYDEVGRDRRAAVGQEARPGRSRRGRCSDERGRRWCGRTAVAGAFREQPRHETAGVRPLRQLLRVGATVAIGIVRRTAAVAGVERIEAVGSLPRAGQRVRVGVERRQRVPRRQAEHRPARVLGGFVAGRTERRAVEEAADRRERPHRTTGAGRQQGDRRHSRARSTAEQALVLVAGDEAMDRAVGAGARRDHEVVALERARGRQLTARDVEAADPRDVADRPPRQEDAAVRALYQAAEPRHAARERHPIETQHRGRVDSKEHAAHVRTGSEVPHQKDLAGCRRQQRGDAEVHRPGAGHVGHAVRRRVEAIDEGRRRLVADTVELSAGRPDEAGTDAGVGPGRRRRRGTDGADRDGGHAGGRVDADQSG